MVGVLLALKMAIFTPNFSASTVREEIIGNLKDKLEPVAKYLGEKTFLMGESVTYVDFVLYEIILHLEWITKNTLYQENDGKYAHFESYKSRIYHLNERV